MGETNQDEYERKSRGETQSNEWVLIKAEKLIASNKWISAPYFFTSMHLFPISIITF